MDKNLAKNNIVYGLLLLLLSIFAIVESMRMPTYSHLEGVYAAPGLVPLLLGITLLLMAIAILVPALRAGGWQQLKSSISKRNNKETSDSTKRMRLTVLYIGTYVFLLLGKLPYTISTSVFIFVYIYSFHKGERNKRIIKALIISVISTAIIFILFTRIFMIRLP
ncbi:MAG: tripartite tricarboxylate transporter TctB family protein [Clostridia bacterium]|nr:tripartite tricarboxylate transporter TctB family protein [Clostridia bacterium]